jgi:ATP-dependent RNA helicase SUPV3L1/SUV3
MERRPKPPELAPAVPVEGVPEPAPAAVSAEGADVLETSDAPEAIGAAADTIVAAAVAPVAAPSEGPAPFDAAGAAPLAEVSEAESTPLAVAVAPVAASLEAPPPAPVEISGASQADPPVSLVAADDGLIEVWRPGRSDERRGRQAHARPPRRADRPAERGPAPDAAKPEAVAVAAASPAAPAPAVDRGTGAPVRHGHKSHRPRPERSRQDRPERDSGGRQAFAQSPRPAKERRDKAPDPNSPFAKLAALKAQLEADAKERR